MVKVGMFVVRRQNKMWVSMITLAQNQGKRGICKKKKTERERERENIVFTVWLVEEKMRERKRKRRGKMVFFFFFWYIIADKRGQKVWFIVLRERKKERKKEGLSGPIRLYVW